MAVDSVVLELGRMGNWLQAVGLLVILWIIVESITLYYNRKRRLLLVDIDNRLKRLEKKLNLIVKKKI